MEQDDIRESVLDIFKSIVENEEYQRNFRERAIAGTLDPTVEEYMLHCVLTDNRPVLPSSPRDQRQQGTGRAELRVVPHRKES